MSLDGFPNTSDARAGREARPLAEPAGGRTTDDESDTAEHSSSVIRPSSLKDRTLTNLYNQRPTWLDMAHTKLDRAVLDAYGWPHDIVDDSAED
jgi:hypothetical protein